MYKCEGFCLFYHFHRNACVLHEHLKAGFLPSTFLDERGFFSERFVSVLLEKLRFETYFGISMQTALYIYSPPHKEMSEFKCILKTRDDSRKCLSLPYYYSDSARGIVLVLFTSLTDCPSISSD